MGGAGAAKGDAYLEHMRTFAIPRYRAVPGNLAAYALRRFEGDVDCRRELGSDAAVGAR